MEHYMRQRRKSNDRTFDIIEMRPKLGQPAAASRNHVICVDGTWNWDKGPGPSNVYRTFLIAKAAPKAVQIAKYYPGVGNKPENALPGELFGGFAGLGAEFIINQAYWEFVRDYNPGDKVFLFGFSRGAAIVRHLANLIRKRGIPKWIKYRDDRQSTIKTVHTKGKLADVKIEALCCWDTVGSFGIPADIGPIKFHSINMFKNISLSGNVKNAYHAVSIDEKRAGFDVTLMNYRKGVEEVWFPGVHGQVGGMVERRRLSDCTMRYMLARAHKHGLILDPQQVAPYPKNDRGVGTVENQKGLTVYMGEPRRIRVEVKGGGAGPRPKIHVSAATKAGYAPEPLAKIARRYDIVED